MFLKNAKEPPGPSAVTGGREEDFERGRRHYFALTIFALALLQSGVGEGAHAQ
jgi:hypothetical protein